MNLSIAVVDYNTPESVIDDLLTSLDLAIVRLKAGYPSTSVAFYGIANGSASFLLEQLAARRFRTLDKVESRSGHGNIGFGRAHNLVIPDLTSDYHLILNPDVSLAPDALLEMVEYMEARDSVAAANPHCHDADGKRAYLLKSWPSFLVLLLRWQPWAAPRKLFRQRLDDYDMKANQTDTDFQGKALLSGCFFFVRTAVFRGLGGFSNKYFLYFEDFDLSCRICADHDVGYASRAGIRHLGGKAGRKGTRHVLHFVRSASRFFSEHGLRSKLQDRFGAE